jgi:tetratricopeptide (TPR) repeat protein
LGTIYWEQGDPDRALEAIDLCIRLGEKAGFLASQVEPRDDLAEIYKCVGLYKRGLEVLEPVLSIPTMPNLAHILAAQMRLLIGVGDLAGAESLLEGTKRRGSISWPIMEILILIANTELTLAKGNLQHALAATEELLDRLHHFGMRTRFPFALHLRAKVLQLAGDQDAARQCFMEARAEAEAIGTRWMLWQILAALAELEDDPAEAGLLRAQARGIVETIAQCMSDVEMKDAFLGLPAVTPLMDSA